MKKKEEMLKENFKILGIEYTEDWDAIRAAYKQKLMEHHPDKNPDNAEHATLEAQKITSAYSEIKAALENIPGRDFKSSAMPQAAPAKAPTPPPTGDALVRHGAWVKVFIPVYIQKDPIRFMDESRGTARSIFDDIRWSDTRLPFVFLEDVKKYHDFSMDPTELLGILSQRITEILAEVDIFQVGVDESEAAKVVDQHSHYKRFLQTPLVAEVSVMLHDLTDRVSEQEVIGSLSAREGKYLSLKKGTVIGPESLMRLTVLKGGLWPHHLADYDIQGVFNLSPIAVIQQYLKQDVLWEKERPIFPNFIPPEIVEMRKATEKYAQHGNQEQYLAELKAIASAADTRTQHEHAAAPGFFKTLFKSEPQASDALRASFCIAVQNSQSLVEVAQWLKQNAHPPEPKQIESAGKTRQ